MTIIQSFKDLDFLKRYKVAACLDSGGLDSAYLICRLKQSFDIDLHVLTVDLGQEDSVPVVLPPFIENNIKRHYVDAKDEFAHEFVMPLLQAHGVYAKQHPLSASLSRPLIAKHLVKLANRLNIQTILHAATPSQNSMRRFNGAIRDLKFNGYWGSPYLQDNLSREDKAKFVNSLGGNVSCERSFSIDTNLFCREFESGTLRGPHDINPPESLFLWTRQNVSTTEEITIEFERGIPTKINGQAMPLVQIIRTLNLEVGKYRLGRYQGLEEGPLGVKVLEIRECPAGFILLCALNELLNSVHTHAVIVAKSQLEQLWTLEASEGRWFAPLKMAIDAFNHTIMENMHGKITYKLSTNECTCVDIQARNPLYTSDRDLLELASNLEIEKELEEVA